MALSKTQLDRYFADGFLIVDGLFDPAELHLKLATVLERMAELPAAKRQVLLALEETPRFRAAHQRLLEIVRKLEQNAKQETLAPAPTPASPPAEKP